MAEDNKREDEIKSETEPETLPEHSLEEPYAFIQEKVKKSPRRKKYIMAWMAAVIVGGAIFGLIAGFVFKAVNGGAGNKEAEVHFDDESSSAEITPGVTPTVMSAASEESQEESKEETPEEKADQQINDFLLLREAMKEVAEEPSCAMVTVRRVSSTEDWFDSVNESAVSGSGVIVADSGSNLIILTTTSLAEGEGQLTVTFCDETICTAQFRKSDTTSGLATIIVSKDDIKEETQANYRVAELGNSVNISTGEPVIAIGSPAGYSGSIEFGEITTISKDVSVSDGLYTEILTNMYGHGGSGVLLDLDGKVIGIISSKLNEDGESIIKALAISPIKTIITKLSNDDEIGYIGIKGDNITEQLSNELDIPVGVYVTAVDENSPAYTAGLQPGDIVTAIDGDSVVNMEAYHRILMSRKNGENLVLTIQRAGTEGYVPVDVTITVAAR